MCTRIFSLLGVRQEHLSFVTIKILRPGNIHKITSDIVIIHLDLFAFVKLTIYKTLKAKQTFVNNSWYYQN